MLYRFKNSKCECMLYRFKNSKCVVFVNNTCENKNYQYYVVFPYLIIHICICEIFSCIIHSSFILAYMYVYIHPDLGMLKCRLFVNNTCEIKNYKHSIFLFYYIIYKCTCKCETVFCRGHPGSGRGKCVMLAKNCEIIQSIHQTFLLYDLVYYLVILIVYQLMCVQYINV